MSLVHGNYSLPGWRCCFNCRSSTQKETPTMTNPKLLIIGDARHGKDTVAEIIHDFYGLNFISSSWYAAARVMMPYYDSVGRPYGTVRECFEDRSNHRAEWFVQIECYSSQDPGRLTKEILDSSDVYVGMRSPKDYAATKDLFDHIIWVDATKRGLPREDASSFGIAFDPEEHILIENAGSLADLHQKVRKVMQSIGISELQPELDLEDA